MADNIEVREWLERKGWVRREWLAADECGFIAPNGDYWPLPYGEHMTFAQDVCEYYDNVYHKLSGWITIAHYTVNGERRWIVVIEGNNRAAVTDAQLERMEKIGNLEDARFTERMKRSADNFRFFRNEAAAGRAALKESDE